MLRFNRNTERTKRFCLPRAVRFLDQVLAIITKEVIQADHQNKSFCVLGFSGFSSLTILDNEMRIAPAFY